MDESLLFFYPRSLNISYSSQLIPPLSLKNWRQWMNSMGGTSLQIISIPYPAEAGAFLLLPVVSSASPFTIRARTPTRRIECTRPCRLGLARTHQPHPSPSSMPVSPVALPGRRRRAARGEVGGHYL
jgi:hypothetical protein